MHEKRLKIVGQSRRKSIQLFRIISSIKQKEGFDCAIQSCCTQKFQFKAEDGWQDFYQDGDRSPSFSSNKVDWRIKPKTKTLRYRNAMLKNNEVVVFTSEPTLEDAYGPTAFLRWIDPEWKEIEVEI